MCISLKISKAGTTSAQCRYMIYGTRVRRNESIIAGKCIGPPSLLSSLKQFFSNLLCRIVWHVEVVEPQKTVNPEDVKVMAAAVPVGATV